MENGGTANQGESENSTFTNVDKNIATTTTIGSDFLGSNKNYQSVELNTNIGPFISSCFEIDTEKLEESQLITHPNQHQDKGDKKLRR
jgi:hypothetical protein